MQRIEIDKTYDFFKLSELISSSSSDAITLVFEKGSSLINNALDLMILKEIGSDKNKSVIFESKDNSVSDFLSSINENRIEFSMPEVNIDGMEKKSAALPTINLFGFLKKNSSESSSVVESKDITYSSTNNRNLFSNLKPILIGVVVLSLFVGIAYAALWYVPSATVKIKLKTDTLIKLIDIKAIKSGAQSVENKTISAVEISVSETESQTIKTTGKLVDGTKAKGKITLINKKTNKEVKIKKGTVIKLISGDKDNIEFLTTENVTVPVATQVEPNPKVNGEAEVSVEASAFGSDYNLDADEKFEVGDYDTDEMVGQNASKITGGKKEEKNVVAQADLDALKTTVEDAVKKTVADSLKRKTISSQTLIENSVKYEVVTASYNKKLDETADELTLSTTMQGTGLAYSKEELDSMIKDLAKTVVPEKYNLDGDNVTYEVASTIDSANSSSVNIQVKLRTSIFPKIDLESTKRELAGMSLDDAQTYLSKINNIAEYEITVVPQMPSMFMKLPINSSNISVKIEK